MFLLDIVSNCDYGLANVIVIVKKFIDIVQILAPIVLITYGIMQFVKMVANPEDKKHWSKIKNMLIALVIIFMVPVILDTVMGLLGEDYTISACWNLAEQASTAGQESQYQGSGSSTRKPESILIDSDKYKPDQSSGGNSSDSGSSYTGSTFTNSKNGIKYNIYNQSDNRWAGHYYSSGQDIKKNGCLNTSVAVVSSAYDKSITPVTVFNSSHRHNYPWSAIKSLTKNTFNCYSGSTKKENIVNFLKDGNVVIIKVYGRKNGGSSKFTSSQHYMALLDINDTQIFVGNAYSNSGYGRATWFDIDVLLTSVNTADYCIPSSSLK